MLGCRTRIWCRTVDASALGGFEVHRVQVLRSLGFRTGIPSFTAVYYGTEHDRDGGLG